MATGQGTAVIDFGGFPGSNETFTNVTGLTTISATSKVEAYFMADTTSDHTQGDHMYAPLFISLTCGPPGAGIGFAIYARSTQKMQGTFQVRFVWAD